MSLIGHDEAIAAFMEAARSDRLHHAWLLAGPEGVGKASFAQLAARWLLAGAPESFAISDEHQTSHLLAAGSHPDFKLLERLFKDKSEERTRSITVDQVRQLQPLFATTPSLSPRRVVVIDAIDDLERGGANALLKNLEEPPSGTIFLLVSHALGRLLPTIRSRCRLLRFGKLDLAQTETVLRRVVDQSEDVAALAAAADGAPGRALDFVGLDIASIDASIERLATQGDPGNALRSQLAKLLGTKAAQPRYEAFLARVPRRIAKAARAGGPDMPERIALWSEARRIADLAQRQSMDPQMTVFELAGLVASLAAPPLPGREGPGVG
ncbi:DNA polymerase-3 subunit delta' [Sphingomonas vulcanisoli]|uniref:DNA polymerase-3 subunit delta n=1 Tax=Sphingomonas vulcanisoli TaxID=1658060 RepID=A0ABX0TS57_9SPHN|nr:AAA family ATPase [Sphingomonas vulcanisoli]NIJ06979.1 DNA polymerase-3 subunit delta' [Sphingomonas vulcanisoli]